MQEALPLKAGKPELAAWDLLRTGHSAADAARLVLRPFHSASATWLSPGQPSSLLNGVSFK